VSGGGAAGIPDVWFAIAYSLRAGVISFGTESVFAA
jgi:hypothetical protein